MHCVYIRLQMFVYTYTHIYINIALTKMFISNYVNTQSYICMYFVNKNHKMDYDCKVNENVIDLITM